MRFFGSSKPRDVDRLRSADPNVRSAAADAVGIEGDLTAVQPLCGLLQDSDAQVRWSAAQALGRLRDARAVKPLFAAAVSDPRLSVRSAASEAIVQIGEPAVAILIGRLPGWVAAEILGRLGDRRAVQPLIDTLPIHAAIVALGELGDPRAVDPLIEILRGEDLLDRAAAARSLAAIGGPRAFEPLVAILDDPRDDDFGDWRETTVAALGQLGDARAVEPLASRYRDADTSEPMRKAIARALERLGGSPDQGPDMAVARITDERSAGAR